MLVCLAMCYYAPAMQVGVYAGLTNGFNIGALMEKGLTVKAGQTPCQK